jgi:serine/threonine protein kinase HipA of HipAB toxin-antitoxin module
VGKFDRLDDCEKLHMQSLGAIAHLDFNNMIADIQRLDLV